MSTTLLQMVLPTNLSKILEEYLALIEQRPDHYLLPSERFSIYQAFGQSNLALTPPMPQRLTTGEIRKLHLTSADKALVFLAILTAEKVLPVWEAVYPAMANLDDVENSSPAFMLETSRRLVKGTTNARRAYHDLCNKFEDEIGGLEYRSTEKVLLAGSAARDALATTFLGTKVFRYNPASANLTDQDLKLSSRDFASEGVKAFAAVDSNEPGAFWKRAKDYRPLVFDSAKVLQFWNWWLTDAIPHAWELIG